MNAFNVEFGQDEGVVRRGAAPRANMERGDWHWSDEESDDDEPDMMDPVIAASSDEENDEDVEDSGYGSEESEAESAINQGHQEEDEDDEMWRELGEAIAMMEAEVAQRKASETAEVAVADEGAADGVASPPPHEPEGIDWESERAMLENQQWMSWWRQQILQQQEAERDLILQQQEAERDLLG
ncbi:uncharacterized protein, partial [Drosophila tropicalis]|uniref:uncharacterized protein n=1 Tax=Drosophila tropicalis TaxID=46794 RepID=UPI0035ABC627